MQHCNPCKNLITSAQIYAISTVVKTQEHSASKGHPVHGAAVCYAARPPWCRRAGSNIRHQTRERYKVYSSPFEESTLPQRGRLITTENLAGAQYALYTKTYQRLNSFGQRRCWPSASIASIDVGTGIGIRSRSGCISGGSSWHGCIFWCSCCRCSCCNRCYH